MPVFDFVYSKCVLYSKPITIALVRAEYDYCSYIIIKRLKIVPCVSIFKKMIHFVNILFKYKARFHIYN